MRRPISSGMVLQFHVTRRIRRNLRLHFESWLSAHAVLLSWFTSCLGSKTPCRLRSNPNAGRLRDHQESLSVPRICRVVMLSSWSHQKQETEEEKPPSYLNVNDPLIANLAKRNSQFLWEIWENLFKSIFSFSRSFTFMCKYFFLECLLFTYILPLRLQTLFEYDSKQHSTSDDGRRTAI